MVKGSKEHNAQVVEVLCTEFQKQGKGAYDFYPDDKRHKTENFYYMTKLHYIKRNNFNNLGSWMTQSLITQNKIVLMLLVTT